MSIKKIMAVVMALGVVGVVSAQAPIAIGDSKLPDPVTGTMSVSYEVNLTAEMIIVDNAVNESNIVQGVVVTGMTTPNAGTIRVNTNYPKWDVFLAFENEGKLTAPINFLPVALQKDDGAGSLEDVELSVMIAARPASGTGANIGAVVLSDLTGDISFAEEIGTVAATALIGGQSGTNIAANGFRATPAVGVDFGVTVGLGLTGTGASAQFVTGNENGIYTETLIFTLVADF
jgi:hypothetical protein